jgi:hypothetical protein
VEGTREIDQLSVEEGRNKDDGREGRGHAQLDLEEAVPQTPARLLLLLLGTLDERLWIDFQEILTWRHIGWVDGISDGSPEGADDNEPG